MTAPQHSITDNWLLTTQEIYKILQAWGVPHELADPIPTTNTHHAIRSMQKARDYTQMQHKFATFCDGSHYRLMVLDGEEWLLFDSLGLHDSFTRDVWSNSGPHFRMYPIRKLEFTPQDDDINCGVWVLHG